MDGEESRPQGQKKQNNVLPLWGNEKTMNLNSMVLTNIQSSPYFKNELFKLKTYHEVVDEIYYKVRKEESRWRIEGHNLGLLTLETRKNPTIEEVNASKARLL